MTRETEERVKKLDPMTKKRILAMHAAGMPKEAIASSISYETGGNKGAAHRIIDGVKAESMNSKRNLSPKPKRK